MYTPKRGFHHCRNDAYFVRIHCIKIDEGNVLAPFRNGVHTLGGWRSGVEVF